MAYNLHVVRTNDFLRLDASGKANLESSREALKKLARACIEKGINCVLLDVRDVQERLSLTELFSLARTFHEIGFKQQQRLAILHPYNNAKNAEFFALCVASRGWQVRAFDDAGMAMEWFSEPELIESSGGEPESDELDEIEKNGS